MRILARILLNGIGILLADRLVPGIEWAGGPLYLMLTGMVIGLINCFVRPVATLLSIPLIVVTLGLFFLVINGAMLWLAAALLTGLTIDGCGAAILGGIVLGLFNWMVGILGKSSD